MIARMDLKKKNIRLHTKDKFLYQIKISRIYVYKIPPPSKKDFFF